MIDAVAVKKCSDFEHFPTQLPLLLTVMSQFENRDDSPFRSTLYQEFLAGRDEILRHKWLESEKAGGDIGFEKALLDWARNHRFDWKNSRRR